MNAPATDFLHRDFHSTNKRVHRLGLSLTYGVEPSGLSMALERGVNYLFWSPIRTGKHRGLVREAIRRRRETLVIATGPTVAWFGGSVRRSCESLLRELKTDYLDVFHLYWLGVTSSWADRTVDEMVKLREEGKIKAFGTSIHDRVKAGELARESPLDMLMIRYNAAHPGAERDIFPHLEARHPNIVAYTATSWRKLLKRPSGWSGPVMTAGDCYRFCLTNDNVDVVLTGPSSQVELEENLAAIDKGPLTAEELAWMREFGRTVHG